MRGERGAIFLVHLVRIAVVRCNQRHAVLLGDRVQYASNAGIHCFHSGLCSVKYTRMADHVAVCIVQDNHIVFAGFNALDQPVGDLVSAHLRLQIVGGHLRGVDQHAVLVGILLFDAAVEEERHMRVFLRLCNAQLGQALVGDVFAKGVLQALRLKGHQDVRHGSVVLRHADVFDREEALLALKAGEFRIDKGARNFARTVRAEVKEDNGIVRADFCALCADGWNDEFVGYILFIGILYRLDRVGTLDAFAVYHGRIGLLHALPAVVAVHRIVAAHHGGNLTHADLLELLGALGHIVFAGSRRDIAAVEQCMDIDLFQAAALGQFHQGIQVGVVAVHTAVGEQPNEMQRGLFRNGVIHCGDEGGVLKEVAILDGLGDAGQLLVHNAAGADVGVANLRVSHLAVRQADVHAGRPDLRDRVAAENAVQVRLIGRLDCVAVIAANAKTV